MRIQLSEHFTFKKLLRFIMPTVIMMIFTSIYTVVDGLFVSNFVGKTAFAAVNLIMPVLMAFGALGFMVGAGGSALVAKVLGEGDRNKANAYFSMLIYFMIGAGLVLSVIGEIIIEPLSAALGAKDEMLADCVLYGRIVIASQTAFMLQNVFQSFFATAEKPKLGLAIVVTAGVSNAVLDALFIVAFKWGLAGAAAATAIGQLIGALTPLIYFARKNNSLLRLVKTGIKWKVLAKACSNGSSEMMTNLSASVVNILYNFQLMKLAGENGVAAYGFIMYISFVFLAMFFGYSIGVAPVIGYNYGAAKHDELKNIFRKSLLLIGITGIVMTGAAVGLAGPLATVFVGYDAELLELTRRGFMLYSFSFLFAGYNVFASAFFTALNNGLISATVSFLRTLVFQIAAVFVMPIFLAIDGIWLAIVVAEALAFIVSASFLLAKRKRYHYL